MEILTDSLVIAAAPSVVWALTVDVEAWPDTTPTITSVERLDELPLQVGSRARVKQPMQRPTVWTVTELDPERRFAWSTRTIGMILLAVHELEPTNDGGTRNTLSLHISGRGGRAFLPLVRGQFQKAIQTENRGFKSAAEAIADAV